MTLKRISQNIDQRNGEVLIESLDDCRSFAEFIACRVKTPLCIALSGTLGAGKTQWTKFFAMALGAPRESISSPTFMLVHEYTSDPPIYHLDAYRIGDEEEMLELGIEEMLDAEAITIVEWADRFPRLLPNHTLGIHFDLGESSESRLATIQATGERAGAILLNLMHHLDIGNTMSKE